MATLDVWHGYSDLCNIVLHTQDFPPYPEASGAKIIRRGVPGQPGPLDYQLSPFSGTFHANEGGDNWYRTVEAVNRQQAPYIPHDWAENLFEILVNCQIVKVGEWSNFFYCFGQKRFGSTFLLIPGHPKVQCGTVRFLNPAWQLESTLNVVPKTTKKLLDKANGLLQKEKDKYQNRDGWDSYTLEHFGLSR